MLNRRTFLQTAAAVAASGPALFAYEKSDGPRVKKAVGYGMIGEGKTLAEKFQIVKEAGFDGVEMYGPDPTINKEEALKARDSAGITLHSVLDAAGWNPRLSDPDPAVRQKGLDALTGALKEAKVYGASAVLLVPGSVTDAQKENFDQVWERSTEQIKKAIPAAKELGVKIAVEVVWNNFLMKPDDFVRFIDQFDPEAVRAYMDIGNVVKWGVPPSVWVRKAGKRIAKLHIKGYHLEKGWVDIGQGSEDWPEIRKALDEVGYHGGWATAEVNGGNRERLKTIARQMDSVLNV